jgi:hypothetical protein
MIFSSSVAVMQPYTISARSGGQGTVVKGLAFAVAQATFTVFLFGVKKSLIGFSENGR